MPIKKPAYNSSVVRLAVVYNICHVLHTFGTHQMHDKEGRFIVRCLFIDTKKPPVKEAWDLNLDVRFTISRPTA